MYIRKKLNAKEKTMGQVHVKEGYELYQIITDFGDPLEIFREGIQNSFDECASEIYVNVYEKQKLGGDSSLIIEIIDNGRRLSKKNIANFFDVANSTKVTDDFIPNSKTKHGYKGHGAKVFFNANEVLICSKTKQGEYWAAQLKNPIEQIADGGKLFYSECDNPDELNISLPEGWESGFMVRIISPRHFKTQHTRFKLNHIYLRDYCKWYTLAGTVETLYNQDLVNKDIKIYLSGLLRDEFVQKYNNQNICDPVPVFKDTTFGKYEELSLGHYFPPERTSDSSMKKYADSIGSNKPKYMFYSKLVYNEIVTTGSIAFRLIISLEGYETKRRYDLNLSRQGKASEEGTHTDGQRYGIWACKGGVPVEKVDDWIEGGRGVGTYTYMQAFIDCDDFQLTANRGSIMNTDIEKLDMIKAEVNKIFKSKTVKNAMQERLDWEELEKIEKSLEDDREDLQKRFKAGKRRKVIRFADGTEVLEPTKTKSGYSESETFVVLMTIMQKYPDLFSFNFMDYNTTKGIDFVVDHLGTPKYIELKGTLTKKINHPFRYTYKFICYDIDVNKNEIVEDKEGFYTRLQVIENANFESNDITYNKKMFTGYNLLPEKTTSIQSMEIIVLKSFLTEVLGAVIV